MQPYFNTYILIRRLNTSIFIPPYLSTYILLFYYLSTSILIWHSRERIFAILWSRHFKEHPSVTVKIGNEEWNWLLPCHIISCYIMFASPSHHDCTKLSTMGLLVPDVALRLPPMLGRALRDVAYFVVGYCWNRRSHGKPSTPRRW